MEKSEFIQAGMIVNTHGVAGEVKIQVWLDSPEFMKKFRRLYIGGREYNVLGAKLHKDCLIVRLEGVEDVNAAMTLKNREVSIRRSDARLPKGRYFIQDIIGAAVVDENGRQLGQLTDVMETPASMIYTVTGEREHLIPAVPEFILNTDIENGVITVHLIDGM